jgi:undecaprenyl-diphosphatase
MDFFHLVVLAIVQGIAEFLPISSSAHLILVPQLLGWPDQGLIFDLSLHLGTLLACFVYFRKDVGRMFAGAFRLAMGQYRDSNARLVLNLVAATLPVGVAGLMAMDLIKVYGRDMHIVAFTTIVFGLLLWYADHLARKEAPLGKERLQTLDDITLPTALMWGVYQAVALVPGVSRSGFSVVGGRALGASRKLAGEFGTLMSIPVTLLAVLASMGDVTSDLNWHNAFSTLATGALVSFVFALAGIHLLVTWCARIGYMPFVLYRLALGMVLVWFIVA